MAAKGNNNFLKEMNLIFEEWEKPSYKESIKLMGILKLVTESRVETI